MTQTQTTNTPKPGSELVSIMASAQHLDAEMYVSTVIASCFDLKDFNKNPVQPTRQQLMGFLMIAREHDLNPITREIYAFEKAGKITPIVSIDGWLKIINQHPDFMGMEFEDHLDEEGGLQAITCIMWRLRNGERTATRVTEYLSECKRDTMPWNKWPIRMLRHKATIQCARYAFGFSGIVDSDEADRIRETDIPGVAHIVPDKAPVNAAKRLVGKIKDKVEPHDLAPERENSEPVGAETAIVAGESLSLKDTDGHNVDAETGEISGFAGAVVDDPKPKVEDIPGVTKGMHKGKKDPKEQSNAEYIADMDKPSDKDGDTKK